MAGIPGLLVALVPCGAQVITLIASSVEADIPGMEPQPAASDAQAVMAAADSAVALTRRWVAGRTLLTVVLRMWRLPVMDMHDSATSLTGK
ncbi:hypothetical protein GCM10011578_042190 [Streptomyces fuscichromogenes]|uniref:Uncharacterized protein n=1 Tax=Streptomyces fuscichromogenes TaxID=1324013 RepID=A0A917XEC5_9ACTN|nr:hypothetical protein GCM10011578_042190 [Streptomyces fuscichromogenes]